MSIGFSKGYFQIDFCDGHREAPLRKKIPDPTERKEWKKEARRGNSRLFKKCATMAQCQKLLDRLLKQYPNHKDCFRVADMMDIYF